MFEFITQDITLQDYPIPTLIHWAQGALVGWLLMQAHFRQHWHLVGYAVIATAVFLCYESLEQSRIGDRGDVDVLNFAMLIHISAAFTAIYHKLRKLRAITILGFRIPLKRGA